MNTPRAALHIASGSVGGGDGESSDAEHDRDPLRRLEAELQRAGGKFSDSERLNEQAWGLLEEAWSLVTECLVLRDGLLDACHEIEQTMDGIQRRLAALPAGAQPSPPERLETAEENAVSSSGDTVAPR